MRKKKIGEREVLQRRAEGAIQARKDVAVAEDEREAQSWFRWDLSVFVCERMYSVYRICSPFRGCWRQCGKSADPLRLDLQSWLLEMTSRELIEVPSYL